MALASPPPSLELLAFSGYAFVGYCVAILGGWAAGRRTGWYVAWLYTAACAAVFLVRTLKQVIRVDAARRGHATGATSRFAARSNAPHGCATSAPAPTCSNARARGLGAGATMPCPAQRQHARAPVGSAPRGPEGRQRAACRSSSRVQVTGLHVRALASRARWPTSRACQMHAGSCASALQTCRIGPPRTVARVTGDTWAQCTAQLTGSRRIGSP
jgi:YIF1